MKRTLKIMALAAVVALFAVPALAQTKECNAEFQSATYSKWYDNRQKDQAAAYEAAKEYLTVCTTDDQYTAALKKFKAAYEAATTEVTNRNKFNEAVKTKNYAEQMRLGKDILATEPDNPAVNIVLGLAGLGDPNLLSQSAPYAKKAIELIGVGKPFDPLPSKDAALAFLNYVVARSTVKSDATGAIPYFLKAAKYESDLKKNPQLYLDLAGAYNDGPQAKLTDEYNAKVGPDKTETEASKLVLANLNPVIDRQIDALARAAALADAANKQAVMDELTKLYEYRNKTKTGVNELVATVLSKPLPDVPTPITSLPTPSAPANSGSQSGANPGTTSAAGAGNGTGTATGTTAGKATGSAKPAASPTPGKKPRSNHRRG